MFILWSYLFRWENCHSAVEANTEWICMMPLSGYQSQRWKPESWNAACVKGNIVKTALLSIPCNIFFRHIITIRVIINCWLDHRDLCFYRSSFSQGNMAVWNYELWTRKLNVTFAFRGTLSHGGCHAPRHCFYACFYASKRLRTLRTNFHATCILFQHTLLCFCIVVFTLASLLYIYWRLALYDLQFSAARP